MSKSIYVIDDNHEIAELIRYSLEHISEATFKTFYSPQAALKKIESKGLPDLIITDLKMSSMNGIELIARLSQIDEEVPIIVFTGHPESLPPGLNCHTVFKNAHGFDRLVTTVEDILCSEPQQTT